MVLQRRKPHQLSRQMNRFHIAQIVFEEKMPNTGMPGLDQEIFKALHQRRDGGTIERPFQGIQGGVEGVSKRGGDVGKKRLGVIGRGDGEGPFGMSGNV